MNKKILVLDDDPTCNEFLSFILQDEGFDVRAAASAAEAFAVANDFDPEVLIADWWLKDGMDGAEVAHVLLERHRGLKVIFTTGSPSQQLSERLGGMQVTKIMEKPIEVDKLLELLHAA